jgi:hypothetical protein
MYYFSLRANAYKTVPSAVPIYNKSNQTFNFSTEFHMTIEFRFLNTYLFKIQTEEENCLPDLIGIKRRKFKILLQSAFFKREN